MKEMTIHAETAKAIRKELKLAFPLVKFSVTSDRFAGGNSVHINWTNGPTSGQVQDLTWKYQYGNFNGMEDIYEYTNSRNDIPQVKYVQWSRNLSESIQEECFKELQKSHKWFDRLFSLDETSENLMREWDCWTARNFVYRVLSKQDLTNGYQIQTGAVA
jgi:hypothetical protein